MYNLLVSGDEGAWEGQSVVFELSRCVREYTDDEIASKYGQLGPEEIEEVRKLPAVFAYETHCEKDPKFGLIKEISKRRNLVRIEYEIIPLTQFLTQQQLSDMSFQLDITGWELNRTHWAIKKVELAKELALKGIRLPQWVQKRTKAIDITSHHFDVALSFPGEVRAYVEQIVGELEGLIGPDKYFYDNNYKAQLARPSLDVLLQDIYRNRARLVVVFLCQKYGEKEWCGLEFRAIREIIMERQHEKLMFVRMDDGKVDGIFKTDGYVSGLTHSAKEIAIFIEERLSLLK